MHQRKLVVFTSVNLAYLDKALALQRSVKRHHPEAEFHLVLSEPESVLDDVSGMFDHVETLNCFEQLSDLRFLFQFNVVELCTLVKPLYANKLAKKRNGDHIVYLDPDTFVFSPLDELQIKHETADVVLTPHLLTPPTVSKHVRESEYSALQHGLYNLGFFSIIANENGVEFSGWWAARLLDVCSVCKENGLFTDQKIIDIAPVYFEYVTILREFTYNVATWNLFERDLRFENDVFYVGAKPMRFYHFTGFDSGAGQRKVDKHFAKNPAIHALWETYRKVLESCQAQITFDCHWRLGQFEDGSPIPSEARLFYRYYLTRGVVTNPYALRFKTQWENAALCTHFRQQHNEAKSFLQYIQSIGSDIDDSRSQQYQALSESIVNTHPKRIFLWGRNDHAFNMEASLINCGANAENIYIIDRNARTDDKRTLGSVNAETFRPQDAVVVCAIAAKDAIQEHLNSLQSNAKVFCVG